MSKKQRQLNTQSLKSMCSEFSDEGFVFVGVSVTLHNIKIWEFVSDTKTRKVCVCMESLEQEYGPRFEIEDTQKVSFDEAFE